ncbi:hypothetical protein Gogos_000107, partial [Gossypium gossypioides]|nr:hypothetical protein [Gossypium gossypioides]
MLDADVTDSVIGEGCVIKNCKIHHSVVGLRSCISEGAIIEDTLLMGADYYETDADRRFLSAKGSVPIGIGKNSHIKRAIIDKNARIGDNVKFSLQSCFLSGMGQPVSEGSGTGITMWPQVPLDRADDIFAFRLDSPLTRGCSATILTFVSD